MSLKCKTAVICCLFVFCQKASAQSFKKGDFVIGPMFQVQNLGKYPAFEQLYSVHASYFVASRWSLEYSVSYAKVPHRVSYIKFYGGVIPGIIGLSAVATSLAAIAVYGFFIPEGISYHIPFKKKLILSPYLNLLTLDYYNHSPGNTLSFGNSILRFSNSAGLRLNWRLAEKLSISPNIYCTVQYATKPGGGNKWGYGAGLASRFVF